MQALLSAWLTSSKRASQGRQQKRFVGPCSHKQLVHKLKGPDVWYAGYPGLLYYSRFYNGKRVPSSETLRNEADRLGRFIIAKQLELDKMVARKKEMQDKEDIGPTLRMVFRRGEIELMHDIRELQTERTMVLQALDDMPRYEESKQQND